MLINKLSTYWRLTNSRKIVSFQGYCKEQAGVYTIKTVVFDQNDCPVGQLGHYVWKTKKEALEGTIILYQRKIKNNDDAREEIETEHQLQLKQLIKYKNSRTKYYSEANDILYLEMKKFKTALKKIKERIV